MFLRVETRIRAVSVITVLGLSVGVVTFCCASAGAQVVNPATSQVQQQQPPPPPTTTDTRLRSFELPPITVFGEAPLKEEDLVGTYEQPRWTAARRFGETRVYVVPKGTVEFEYWLIPERDRDGGTYTETQYEVEFGLPHRMQLDLYAVGHQTGSDGFYGIDGQKVELRYAFADWNRIWGNPTLYMEWEDNSNAPPHFEGKLLLGGQITSRWHWGSNLVWEHELSGEKENSNEWTTGLSYTVLDSKVSVGLESKLALVNHESAPGVRTPFSTQLSIGPSIQWRPLPQAHLDLAPLIGVTNDAPRVTVFIVFGWEF